MSMGILSRDSTYSENQTRVCSLHGLRRKQILKLLLYFENKKDKKKNTYNFLFYFITLSLAFTFSCRALRSILLAKKTIEIESLTVGLFQRHV